MSDGTPAGGYKLMLVPADSIEETAASTAAGEAYVAARHGGDSRTLTGPFEVVADVGPDRRITMTRVFFEENVEVIG